MARETHDLWPALPPGGEIFATEEDYEHGYAREVRSDLAQYVAFQVSGETYGVAIAQMSEISMPLPTTPVPRTAEFVRGIGNVRGQVLPIVDLALRLRLAVRPETRNTRVLIVRYEDESYGLVVDRVEGVVPIAPEDLESAPSTVALARGEFIRALARHEGRIIIVLDLGQVLAPRDFLAPITGGKRR